jgi:type IV secretion system protein VirD4
MGNLNEARWAGPLTLAAAGLFAPDGLILGRVYNRVLRDASDRHLLCVASTGSGKSASFVLPNLFYGWEGSVVVYDPSTELHRLSGAHRAQWTRVVHLAPTSRTSDCCNPLDAVRIGEDEEVRDAQLVGEMLADPDGKGEQHMSDAGAHFMALAAEGLGGLVLYGRYTQRATSLPALNGYLVRHPWRTVLRAMERYPHAAIQRAGAILRQIGGENESSAIFSTLTRTLRIYTDPILARMAQRSDFAWRDLRERARPMSLYLSIPFADQHRLQPWGRLIIRQALDEITRDLEGLAAYAPPHRTDQKWPVLALLDEFAALGKLEIVSRALGYVRKYGLRLALITPSLQDVFREYGEHHNLFEASKLKLAFGIEDTTIAKTVSGWIGQRTRWQGQGPHRRSTREPLFSDTAVTQMPERQMVLVAGTVRVRAWQTYYKTLTF